MTEPVAPTPDDKDWTWVLRQPCPDCGFDAVALDRAAIPALVRSSADAFRRRLECPDATSRPSPEVWSPLEYACHVRDICRLFDERLRLMLTEDDPLFANWDQDETAVADRYWAQKPATVASALADAAERIACAFGAIHDEWDRPGRRSNGTVFTVDSFGRYFVHDLVHHVHDLGG